MPKLEVYATLLVLAIIFTTIDIAVSTFQLVIPSLIFSSITLVIGFIGAYLSRTIQVEKQYENAVTYIKKNFGIANTILSILDVICCILAFLTGIFVIMLIFRVAIAVRIAVYINKYRNVAFAIWGIAYMHIFKRNERRKIVMKTKNTILQNIIAIISGVFGVGGILVLFMPEWAGMAQEVSKYIASISEALAVSGVAWLSQTHDKVLTNEEIEATETIKIEKQALKEAKKQAKKDLKEAQEQAIKELAEKKLQEIKQPVVQEVKTEDIQIVKGE